MSDGFVRVAACDELRKDGGIQRTVGDREVGLFKLGDGVCAIDGVCPHVGGPLGQPEVVLGQFGLGPQQVGDPAQIAQGAHVFAGGQPARDGEDRVVAGNGAEDFGKAHAVHGHAEQLRLAGTRSQQYELLHAIDARQILGDRAVQQQL